jgi:putative ABC transport system permease protein
VAREIGIRAAIGASSARLRCHVLAEGLRPTLAGLIAGRAGAAAAASAARALLFEITPGDAWTHASTTALLLSVGLASSWLPARRAARLDPSAALRAE